MSQSKNIHKFTAADGPQHRLVAQAEGCTPVGRSSPLAIMTTILNIARERIGFVSLAIVALCLQACGPAMLTYRRDISSHTPLTLLKLKVPT
jgi:hypothetical protein